jgi:hypothetical protein
MHDAYMRVNPKHSICSYSKITTNRGNPNKDDLAEFGFSVFISIISLQL